MALAVICVDILQRKRTPRRPKTSLRAFRSQMFPDNSDCSRNFRLALRSLATEPQSPRQSAFRSANDSALWTSGLAVKNCHGRRGPFKDAVCPETAASELAQSNGRRRPPLKIAGRCHEDPAGRSRRAVWSFSARPQRSVSEFLDMETCGLSVCAGVVPPSLSRLSSDGHPGIHCGRFVCSTVSGRVHP